MNQVDIDRIAREIVGSGPEVQASMAFNGAGEKLAEGMQEMARVLLDQKGTLVTILGDNGRIHVLNLVEGIEQTTLALKAMLVAQQAYVREHGLDGRTFE